MTKIFLEEYFHTGGPGKCLRCKGPAQKSLCPKHLKQARIEWRVWTVERVAKKLCVVCNHRSHLVSFRDGRRQQGVYCHHHRERNRLRCLNWAQEHRDEIRAEFRRRRNLKICVNNPKHGKAFKQHITCKACFAKDVACRKLNRT